MKVEEHCKSAISACCLEVTEGFLAACIALSQSNLDYILEKKTDTPLVQLTTLALLDDRPSHVNFKRLFPPVEDYGELPNLGPNESPLLNRIIALTSLAKLIEWEPGEKAKNSDQGDEEKGNSEATGSVDSEGYEYILDLNVTTELPPDVIASKQLTAATISKHLLPLAAASFSLHDRQEQTIQPLLSFLEAVANMRIQKAEEAKSSKFSLSDESTKIYERMQKDIRDAGLDGKEKNTLAVNLWKFAQQLTKEKDDLQNTITQAARAKRIEREKRGLNATRFQWSVKTKQLEQTSTVVIQETLRLAALFPDISTKQLQEIVFHNAPKGLTDNIGPRQSILPSLPPNSLASVQGINEKISKQQEVFPVLSTILGGPDRLVFLNSVPFRYDQVVPLIHNELLLSKSF